MIDQPSQLGSMQNGEYQLRGTAMSKWIHQHDFLSMVWQVWTNQSLSPKQRTLLEACLSACVDHGAEPPSAHVTRVVASCGKSLADSVAAGLLTIGPRHGNAGSAAALLLSEACQSSLSVKEFVDHALQREARLPGFGHPEYTVDPRTQALFQCARAELKKTPACDMAEAMANCLSEKKGKSIPVNVDGAIGAVMNDMGAPSCMADAIFLLGRTVGLIAHAREVSGSSSSYIR